MVSKRFAIFLALRFGLLVLTLLALTVLFTVPGYHAATLLTLGLIVVQIVEVLRFIAKTNRELVRFLDAARHADFSQRFDLDNMGAGFAELGLAFTDILKRFQHIRASQEYELRHLKAMVEHVPVPLISIHQQGQVTIWNNSAKRLFGTHHVSQLADFKQFGDEFAKQVSHLVPGERSLVVFSVDGMDHQLAISATQILYAGRQEMLVSMQDIQSELDSAQLQAWQELVRVLTHEIMNSITPIASLAKTAAELAQDARQKVQGDQVLSDQLADVCDASETVARRSDGLTQFVGSYRRLTRLPTPNKQRIYISELFAQVTKLSTQKWAAKGISLSMQIQPQNLQVEVDQGMVEQVLINLLQNAEQALQTIEQPQVLLSANLNLRGHVVIEVGDNGKGVADDISRKIFVPFYTTKREGSGVGLALTRQVMMAHGGSVKVGKSQLGGASFTLVF
jgi:two-component system nitrogen regulation sensor histidine kinase NtrY